MERMGIVNMRARRGAQYHGCIVLNKVQVLKPCGFLIFLLKVFLAKRNSTLISLHRSVADRNRLSLL